MSELAGEKPLEEGRVRKPGGGRKKAEAQQPGLVAALDLLIEPTTRGDPESPMAGGGVRVRLARLPAPGLAGLSPRKAEAARVQIWLSRTAFQPGTIDGARARGDSLVVPDPAPDTLYGDGFTEAGGDSIDADP